MFQALAKKNWIHCVITAGTGAGKTESFLMPLFAQLAKEVRNWSVPGQAPSHINGFRTGFSKVSQVFTKELFYQLPMWAKKKLVIFSDSREDAAQIANGVERNHYSELVREMVLYELRNLALGRPQLLSDIENNNAVFGRHAQESLRDNVPLEQDIRDDLQLVNIPIPSGLPQVHAVLLQSSVNEANQRLQEIKRAGQERTISINSLLPDTASCGVPWKIVFGLIMRAIHILVLERI